MNRKYMNRRIKNFKAGDDQCFVEVYPKSGKHDRSDIDIFRLTLVAIDEKTGKKEKQELEFTPDEAILVAGNIMTATMFWLINYKPYWDTFMKRKRSLTKKIDKAL